MDYRIRIAPSKAFTTILFLVRFEIAIYLKSFHGVNDVYSNAKEKGITYWNKMAHVSYKTYRNKMAHVSYKTYRNKMAHVSYKTYWN